MQLLLVVCCDNTNYVERRISFNFEPGDIILCFYNFKEKTLKFNKFKVNFFYKE